jgi:AraC-like DNA-binding protein
MPMTVYNAMVRSRIVHRWIRSFQDFSGINLDLFAVNDPSQKLADGLKRHLNPFCRLCISNPDIQKLCVKGRDNLCEKVSRSGLPESAVCFAGLWDCAIPISAAGKPVATLFLSGFSTEQSLKTAFGRTCKFLQKSGIKLHQPGAEAAYMTTRVLSPDQFKALRHMLAVSCGNLAEFANRRLIQAASYENPNITRAKQYVRDHFAKPITMEEVARVAGLSVTYFSKVFKKETGMPFPEYVNRVRLENVKGLLLSREKSVNETAFEAGFESISHFNRVFKKYEGTSPIRYREEMETGILSKTQAA